MAEDYRHQYENSGELARLFPPLISLVMLPKPSWLCELHYSALSADLVLGHLKHCDFLSQLRSSPLINQSAVPSQPQPQLVSARWMSDGLWCIGNQKAFVSFRGAVVRRQRRQQAGDLFQDNKIVHILYSSVRVWKAEIYCLCLEPTNQDSKNAKRLASGLNLKPVGKCPIKAVFEILRAEV